jgi:hypothetical protein
VLREPDSRAPYARESNDKPAICGTTSTLPPTSFEAFLYQVSDSVQYWLNYTFASPLCP